MLNGVFKNISSPRALAVRALGGIVLLLQLSACHTGGVLTASSSTGQRSASILVPTIATPASSPFYSNTSSLVINGLCNTGDIVNLTGSFSASTPCTNLTYQFTVSQSNDGIYTLLVSQSDANGNASGFSTAVWVRATSVPAPTLTSPGITPFLSGLSVLTLAGSCETGATIAVTGDATQNTSCVNSQFTMMITKVIDGNYNFLVTQTDPAGNSASTAQAWNKHALTISPNNTTAIVGTSLPLVFSGGSGSYSAVITTNASGGSLSASGTTYFAGTLASATDIITLTDSLGSATTANITTLAAAADHFLPINTTSTGTIGQAAQPVLTAQVVDRYNNGIANFSVLEQIVAGDATLNYFPVTTSNGTGVIQIPMTFGYQTLANWIRLTPATGALPDLAGSGKSTLSMKALASSKALGTGNFGLNFNTINAPTAMAFANFGGHHADNTHKDIAVVSSSGSKIGVLLNNGNGMYTASSYNTCSGPNSIATADLNGDGYVDIVVACSSGFVSVLLGNSIGGFGTHQDTVTVSGPVAVGVGNFRNSPGLIDIAVVSSVSNTVAIHLGDGTGHFGAPQTVSGTTNLAPTGMVVSDINKDGYPDVVVLNGNGTDTISYLRNKADGTGTLNANVDLATGNSPQAIAGGDFNFDGYPDIAVVNSNDDDVGIFLNSAGNLTAQQAVMVGSDPTSLAAGDLQGSGYAGDLAVVNYSDNTISILLSNTAHGASTVSFTAPNPVSVLIPPSAIAAADTNGDGHVDIAGAIENSPGIVQVMPGNGAGSFGNSNPTGSLAIAVASGTFFVGDKSPAVVVANKNANTFSLYRNMGNASYQLYGNFTTGSAPVAIGVGDFNADGYLDVAVVCRSSNTVEIFMGNGSGGFATKVDYTTGTSPVGLSIGDFNGDGYLDLAVANGAANTVSVILNTGTSAPGNFNAKTDFAVGQGVSGIAVGDFNGDGRLDIATVNNSDETVSILLGNGLVHGDGTFQLPAVPYNVGGSPVAITAADISGDGLPDLLIVNQGDATVSYLQASASGFIIKPTINVGGGIMSAIVTGDFHGQGRLDIAIANGDATFDVLQGFGGGAFGSPITFTSSNSSATFIGVSATDSNADGIVDLLLVDSNNGDFEYWTGQ